MIKASANAKTDLEDAMMTTSCAMLVSGDPARDHPIIFVNPAFTQLTGYEPSDIIGRNCRLLQGADTDVDVAADIHRAIGAGEPIRCEILNYRKNGDPFWNDLRIDPIRNKFGIVTGFVGVQFDATASHSVREAQLATELRLEDIISHVPGYVYRRILKTDGSIELSYLSPSINRTLGIARGILVTSATFYDHVHPEDRQELIRAIRQSATDLSVFREEFRLVSSTGAVRWFRSDALARLLPNGDIMWDGIAIEITAERKSETDLAFLAFHDSLTGLCNRDLFKSALLKVMSSPSRDEELAIFFIDLDSFQEINDSLGQEVGDDVLRVVGDRLTKFSKGAAGTVARLGGDEFAILIPAVSPAEPVTELALRIHAELAQPMHVMGQEIIVQACVGAAMHSRTSEISDPADVCSELMKQADLALLAAKREGRGSCLVYASDLDDRFQNRMALRQSLHNAILNDQLELHYQPLVDLASGRIVGAEALVRWNHPELGLQRPDLFIPLAEKSGFIVPLGAWVINEAMRQSQAWRLQGFTTPRISMNVSSVQLQKPGFIATIEEALANTGADPRDFEFELTEGLLIEASTEILSILSAIKAFGFWITIDDFGTGNATFKYLRDFPIDKIKIDQVFVRQLVIDSSDAFIIHAMVALARSLSVTIVAEGIETEMQREFLRREGCQVGQGYLFSMPLMAEDFGWMLQNHVALPMFTRD